MNAQTTCAAIAILTLCGCATVPKTPEGEMPVTRQEGQHTLDQKDEQQQWLLSAESKQWMEYVCSLPEGPEKEAQQKMARERGIAWPCGKGKP